jgi:DNA primase
MTKNYASFVSAHLDVRTRSGHEWQCLCPYHEDTQPSFSVNVRKGLFVCYACNAKGTMKQLADFLGHKQEGRTFNAPTTSEVKAKLADLMKDQSKERFIDPAWVDSWRIEGHKEEWANRGIVSDEVLNLFCLGYDMINDTLIIPVHSSSGKVSSIIRRFLDPDPGSPKYKYDKGFKKSENLYGFWQSLTWNPVARPRLVAITEGSIDTLKMWEAKIPSVALLGASVSNKQLKLLKRLDPTEFLIMTDRDTAGQTVALELSLKLRGSGALLSEPAYWPDHAKDPGDLTISEIRKVVQCSRPLPIKA